MVIRTVEAFLDVFVLNIVMKSVLTPYVLKFWCRFVAFHKVIFVRPREGGVGQSGALMVGDYCLSCVDQIISVIRIYLLVIASPLSPLLLFVKHTPSGQLSVRVILHILCGKGQRGALRLTPSLPREKVWSCQTPKKPSTTSRLDFTQRAFPSILRACMQLISCLTFLCKVLPSLLITALGITAISNSTFPADPLWQTAKLKFMTCEVNYTLIHSKLEENCDDYLFWLKQKITMILRVETYFRRKRHMSEISPKKDQIALMD